VLKRRTFSYDLCVAVITSAHLVATAWLAAASIDATPPLASAGAVRALSPADAARALPVKLRALVTFVARDGSFLFVQDATDGIFVDAMDEPPRGARVGDLAAVEGATAPGLFAPQVRLRHLTPLGPGAPPAPARASYADLAGGKLDSRLCELAGTIRSVGREARTDGRYQLVMTLATGGATFTVYIHIADPPGDPGDPTLGLVDATVVVRGVAGGVFNGQRQQVGVVLHVPDARAIRVVQPPLAPDPYAQVPRSIQSLFRFAPGAELNHRVRVDGVVTYQQPGSALYISARDGSAGLQVRTRQSDPLAPGDAVQVVGFPAMGDWTPVLEDATFRRAGRAAPPAPIASTAELEVGPDAHDARLVTLEAELLDVEEHRGKLALALKSGPVIFDAELAGTGDLGLGHGSRLRLTGVSAVRTDRALERPVAFKLLLRSAGDMVVIGRPSWWTLRRLLRALAAFGGLLSLVAIWAVLLRRRVREQTEIIRFQLRNEAALEDRYRDLFENAGDIVFSQGLDGHLLAINRAAEQITGYRRGELLARTVYDLIPAERREEARRRFAALGAGGGAGGGEAPPPPPPFETEILAADGARVALEMSLRATVKDGRVVGVEGIARDVSARKRAEAELAAAHRRLLEVSRRAGMAEVASSVLHNVGNVLNTVNVSATLLAERLRASRVPNLARAVEMLRAHETDLHTFLTDDPQGRQLAAYLSVVAVELGSERSALLAESEAVSRNIDHIKEIVAMQQGYARVAGGVEEALRASALVDDAVRMQAASASHAGIDLARELAVDPEVTVERHKVLQILVNLIANARHACAGGAGGRVAVRLELAAGETRFRVIVTDDGVGIAAQDLTRIFQHGFTTRKDGHGFGLHSAALTARELGGSLTAASDGPGHGATFTLELPVHPRFAQRKTTQERLEIIGATAV
jgi:PAS domain S-box-containing protein